MGVTSGLSQEEEGAFPCSLCPVAVCTHSKMETQGVAEP